MKINIIYATESGATKRMAETLQKFFAAANHQADLYCLGKDGFKPTLEGYDLLLFGSPTYYDGQVADDMGRFLNEFQGTLNGHKVGVFSLGDSGYFDFCGSAKILEEWVVAHNGVLPVSALKIDCYDDGLEHVEAWVAQLLAKTE